MKKRNATCFKIIEIKNLFNGKIGGGGVNVGLGLINGLIRQSSSPIFSVRVNWTSCFNLWISLFMDYVLDLL